MRHAKVLRTLVPRVAGQYSAIPIDDGRRIKPKCCDAICYRDDLRFAVLSSIIRRGM
jgi:hypothetical protein